MIICRLKMIFKILWVLPIMLFLTNCRSPVVPTEDDLAGYGWTLYESGKYQEAREWFYDAIAKDSTYLMVIMVLVGALEN